MPATVNSVSRIPYYFFAFCHHNVLINSEYFEEMNYVSKTGMFNFFEIDVRIDSYIICFAENQIKSNCQCKRRIDV